VLVESEQNMTGCCIYETRRPLRCTVFLRECQIGASGGRIQQRLGGAD
jgi:hypothetical protein